MDDVKVKTRTGAFRESIISFVPTQVHQMIMQHEHSNTTIRCNYLGYLDNRIFRLPKGICGYVYSSRQGPRSASDGPLECYFPQSPLLSYVNEHLSQPPSVMTRSVYSIKFRRHGCHRRSSTRHHSSDCQNTSRSESLTYS
jgi:hypothetical protein